jgi:spermidine synthase
MSGFGRRRGRDPSHAQVQISEKQGVRFLHLGGPAVQSAMRLRDPWALELEYTRAMMACLLFCPAPRDMALIGLGGGSLAKFIHRHLPDTRLTALEVNGEVVDAARAFFLLPPDDERLSVRVVDGYDARRIVEALASEAFYRACLDMLRPGGVAVFNLWGSDQSFPVYFERLGRVFGERLLRLPSERKGNIIVFAFPAPGPDLSFATLTRLAQRLGAGLGLEMEDFLARMRNWNTVSASAFLL